MANETVTAFPSTPPRVQNGTYTIDHAEQGHFTVKLYTAQQGALAGKRILALLVGPDNQNDYRGVAFWDDEAGVANVWKKHRGPGSRSKPDGYAWQTVGWSRAEQKLAIWADLAMRGEGGHWARDGYSLLLESRCVRCNRPLTDPESIRLGIGPECGGRS